MFGKRIIISVHDVSPRYVRECGEIIEALRARKKELLVVLNWEGRHDLARDAGLLELIRKQAHGGDSIVLHGLRHYGETRSKVDTALYGKAYGAVAEFKGLDATQTKVRVRDAVTTYETLFGGRPTKLVPSRWKGNDTLEDICEESGIRYTECRLTLKDLVTRKKCLSMTCCFDYGDNRILNRMSRLYARLATFVSYVLDIPLRYSLHPNDVRNGNIEYALNMLNRLLDKGWQPIATEDVWHE